jgi:hypothetical protein
MCSKQYTEVANRNSNGFQQGEYGCTPKANLLAMAPQRTKRKSKDVDDDDFGAGEPSQSNTNLLKLVQGQSARTTQANKAFRAEGRSVLDETQKEMDEVVSAYQTASNELETAMQEGHRQAEALPCWDHQIVKALNMVKVRHCLVFGERRSTVGAEHDRRLERFTQNSG